jgi:hypothetical protein
MILLCLGIASQAQTGKPVTGKAELSKIYSTAIGQYLREVSSNEKSAPDTLYLNDRKNGQEDDFPDIVLPKSIAGTRIIVLKPDEAKARQKNFKKSSPLVNLMGWVEKEKAEFIFVTFYPGYSHRYDWYINYNFNHKTNAYELMPDARCQMPDAR